MPKFEKPQKGNPHQLTIGQHTFPARSIARFGASDGRVEVHMKDRRLTRRAKPTDGIFCARRAWDHGNEIGFMKEIEDRFQRLADSIVDGRVLTFNEAHTYVISSFYVLWRVREELRDQLEADVVLEGILPGQAWSKDEEEGLEKAGFVVPREATIPARFMNGLLIPELVGGYLRQINPTANWGVVRASGGDFVVPDWPAHQFVPIHPTLALVNPARNQTLDRKTIGLVNEQLRLASRIYYFGNQLAACP